MSTDDGSSELHPGGRAPETAELGTRRSRIRLHALARYSVSALAALPTDVLNG